MEYRRCMKGLPLNVAGQMDVWVSLLDLLPEVNPTMDNRKKMELEMKALKRGLIKINF